MSKVESFSLDHTKVQAPYVRLIDTSEGEHGDIISNFDIRLSQPNQSYVPVAALHALEHLFAVQLKKRLSGYIACSTFGCDTGFHLILFGEHSAVEVAKAEISALKEIRDDIKLEDIPRVNPKNCANHTDISLLSVKHWADIILKGGISSDPYVRKVVEG